MRTVAALLGVLALAGGSQAQTPAADAIDDILRGPARPTETPPPQQQRTGPVFLHETGKAPDGPPGADEIAYDSRLKSSAAASRSFEGPMEGAWKLLGGGRDLYHLQLVDRDGWIDGAWRDPQRAGAVNGSGFIAEVRRGGALVLRFSDEVVAVLEPHAGGWRGQLTEGGRSLPVTLVRRTP